MDIEFGSEYFPKVWDFEARGFVLHASASTLKQEAIYSDEHGEIHWSSKASGS